MSKVSAGSYKMNQTFDNVQVLGVNIDDVNSVLVNGNVHGNFTYSPEVKVKFQIHHILFIIL